MSPIKTKATIHGEYYTNKVNSPMSKNKGKIKSKKIIQFDG